MTFIPSSYSCPAGVGLMLPLIGDSIFSVFFVDTARPVILKRAKLLRQYSFYYPSYILASSTSLSALMDEICSMKTNDWEYLGTQAGRVIGLPSWRLDSGNLFVFSFSSVVAGSDGHFCSCSYNKLPCTGWLTNRHFFLMVLEVEKSKIKAPEVSRGHWLQTSQVCLLVRVLVLSWGPIFRIKSNSAELTKALSPMLGED